jgi:peroxiredoxin
MKKIFFLLIFVPALTFGQKKSSFKISGDISQVKDNVSWVLFSISVDGQWKTDSVQPKNGKYSFKGTITEPQQGRFSVKYHPNADGTRVPTGRPKNRFTIYLEKGKINIVSIDSFSNVTVKGSTANDEIVKLNAAAKSYNDKMAELDAKYDELKKVDDKEGMKKIEKEYQALDLEMREKVYAAYVDANPKSPMAVYAARQYAGWDIDPAKAETVFNKLSASAKKWKSAVALKERIEIAKKTAIGEFAMEFTQNDTLDIPVKLSSFRGKYLLVDFWASWCVPCRQENPNVVKAFHKYKNKGFFILGISLDNPNAKDKWLKAIRDDQLEWTHVSDLKYWDNEVAKQYGIRSIPQNLLLDPEGKIIAKNLRGDDLDKKLEEVVADGKKAF